MQRWLEASLEVGRGLHPGPRVRPRLDRWWVDEAAVASSRALGGACLVRVPGLRSVGPRVLLTMDSDPERGRCWLARPYVDAVLAAGGLPVLVPPGAQPLAALLEGVDGVVVTGGAFDIHPSHYGQQVEARLDRVDEDRTGVELALAREALRTGLPLLGVCGGLQAMAVAAGGTLVQDLPHEPSHEQPTDPATAWHPVRLSAPLDALLGAEVGVNSTHHQAVDQPGAHAEVIGLSPDGVIEAVRYHGAGWALGVQWHPERMGQLAPFQLLVAEAERWRALRGEPG